MPFTKLQFRPGVNREITQYANEGGWFDMDKVRFGAGFPEKIGGWTLSDNEYYAGTCRSLHQWTDLRANLLTGIGTNLKYYIRTGGTLYDITPIRETTAAGGATFSATSDTISSAIDAVVTTIPLTSVTGFPTTGGRIRIDSEDITYTGISGSSLTGCVRGEDGTTAASHSILAVVGCASITVTDVSHGALEGDFVTFSGAATLGGNMTAAVLNQEYQIVATPTTGTYVIEARTTSTIVSISTKTGPNPVYVYSTAADVGTGGASIVAEYQINSGADSAVSGSGWGAGAWSRDGWSSPSAVSVAGDGVRLWSADNFGEDLIYNVRNKGIYYWDATGGPSVRGVALSSLAGAATTPTIAAQVIVSERDRHVIAFGCDDEFNIGVQDRLLIRFSDQESLTDWRSLPTNTAGSIRIGSGSKIICAVETKQQTMVFTDVSLHAMQYLGPPFTFGITVASENTTIAGPNAAISVDDTVYWMGINDFYSYNGVVSSMDCTVRQYVFGDLNASQIEKVTVGLNSSFSEVWWFYPSAASETNDRYVVYNYRDGNWYFGTMARNAWIDRGVDQLPLAAGDDYALYFHESGLDDGSTEPASGINAYIQSSGSTIGTGDQFALIQKVIPDIDFTGSGPMPSVVMTIKANNFPGGSFLQEDGASVMRTASLPVQQFTNQLYLRLRGRAFFFRIESTEAGTTWKLGSPRVEVRTDGMR
jgi:hypothetical protein